MNNVLKFFASNTAKHIAVLLCIIAAVLLAVAVVPAAFKIFTGLVAGWKIGEVAQNWCNRKWPTNTVKKD